MRNHLKKRKLLKSSVAFLLSVIMFISIAPMTAYAYSGAYYGYAYVGSSKYFDLSSNWGFDVYAFTPSTTGYYTFYSYSNSGDPYFYLVSPSYYSTVYNSLASYGCRNDTARSYCLAYDDDSNGNANFKTNYICYAGQTYYCFLTKYSTSRTYANFSIAGPAYNSLTLERNGGSGGTSRIYGYSGQAWTSTSASSGISYITPPTRSGYTFVGYYNTWAATGGELFIASNGYVYPSAKGASGSVVARWSANAYTLTLNNQGVSNTTQIVSYGDYLPSTISKPARTGYTFQGYYTGVGGTGTQYYNSSGTRNAAYTMSGNQTLYAYWTPSVYQINYQGMDGADGGANHPTSHTYGTATSISNPSKAEYTFMGWSIPGQASRFKDLTLAATAYTAPITLTANWVKSTDVSITEEGSLTANTDANQADLNSVFTKPVEDTTAGVTSDEMSNNAAVKLELKVTETTVNEEATNALENVSNGDVVTYFDATVKKTVTSLSGQETVTTLKEIPTTVAVTIPLAENQRGKSSYSVYRYHTYQDKSSGDSYSEVQEISNDSAQTEYYAVNSDNIVVYTRMFSTFAIVAGETSLTARPDTAEDKDGTGVDVQGKVSQSGLEAVYKLDISWGAMAFVYTTAAEWDPYNHTWGDATYAWADSSFDGTNNKLTVANHSNADVNAAINFTRVTGQLDETEVTFHQNNAIESSAIDNLYIPKVPAEGEEAQQANAYLYLTGTPATLPGATGADTYTKVGVITLTFAGDSTMGLTPKSE